MINNKILINNVFNVLFSYRFCQPTSAQTAVAPFRSVSSQQGFLLICCFNKPFTWSDVLLKSISGEWQLPQNPRNHSQ